MADNCYLPLLNSTTTNLFGQLSVQKNDVAVVPIRFTNQAQIRNDGLCVTIEDFANLRAPLSVGTLKVLDVLLLQLTEQNGIKTQNPDPLVKVFLDNYMSLLQIPDTKNARDEARKNLKNYLDTLTRISLAYTETCMTKTKGTGGKMGRSKKTEKRLDCKLFESCVLQKGVILARFSSKLVEHLVGHSYITQYPAALLRLSAREAVAYYLGKKLCFNYGLIKNVAHNRNDFISVKSLLKATPALGLNGKDASHWRRDVLGTFENAMNTLQHEGIIDQWCYRLAKRQPVDDIDAALKSYEKFSEKLFIEYTIKNFPLPTPKTRKPPTTTS